MSREEIIQRNDLTTRLLRSGWNVFLPVFDEGIDMIAHREDSGDLRLIQQKSRWTIMRKYLGRDIWIAFPDRGIWHVAPHDAMVTAADTLGHTDTASWRHTGNYHVKRMSRSLAASMATYRLGYGNGGNG